MTSKLFVKSLGHCDIYWARRRGKKRSFGKWICFYIVQNLKFVHNKHCLRRLNYNFNSLVWQIICVSVTFDLFHLSDEMPNSVHNLFFLFRDCLLLLFYLFFCVCRALCIYTNAPTSALFYDHNMDELRN